MLGPLKVPLIERKIEKLGRSKGRNGEVKVRKNQTTGPWRPVSLMVTCSESMNRKKMGNGGKDTEGKSGRLGVGSHPTRFRPPQSEVKRKMAVNA